MTTITALKDRVWVPIIVGSYDHGFLLRINTSRQIPTDLWNLQSIAQHMVTIGDISAS